MSRVICRIGPLVFWQYAVCLVILPLYFPIAMLVSDEDTWPGWLLPRGVIAALVVAVIVWRHPLLDLIDRAALIEPEGEPRRNKRALRVERHFHVFLYTCLASGLLAVFQSLSMVESAGMANGLLAYLLGWHLFLSFPLMAWAKNRDAERPLPPKRAAAPPGLAELWVVPPDDDGEEGPVTVALKTEGIRSLEEVVVAVLGRPVLPAVDGGRRRWSIEVDGAPVGELTQSWHHPRWWPPIEWNASPSTLFKSERVTFRPIDGPRRPESPML
jgi:hypothetical protein